MEPTKRKSLSKKTRFEVFKRDGFTCQYCGNHPPTVVLNADHINPVANGGCNNMDNLITSCEACNSGKSANLLSDIPQSLKDKAEQILEREAQIKGYQRVMDAKKARLEEEAEEVCAVYEQFHEGFTLTESALISIRRFIDALGVHACISAMESAHLNKSVSNAKKFRYFCGICWNKIRESNNGTR